MINQLCEDSVSEAMTSDLVSVVMARGSDYQSIKVPRLISTVALSPSPLLVFHVAGATLFTFSALFIILALV